MMYGSEGYPSAERGAYSRATAVLSALICLEMSECSRWDDLEFNFVVIGVVLLSEAAMSFAYHS